MGLLDEPIGRHTGKVKSLLQMTLNADVSPKLREGIEVGLGAADVMAEKLDTLEDAAVESVSDMLTMLELIEYETSSNMSSDNDKRVMLLTLGNVLEVIIERLMELNLTMGYKDQSEED
jgi:hypothetical protein